MRRLAKGAVAQRQRCRRCVPQPAVVKSAVPIKYQRIEPLEHMPNHPRDRIIRRLIEANQELSASALLLL